MPQVFLVIDARLEFGQLRSFFDEIERAGIHTFREHLGMLTPEKMRAYTRSASAVVVVAAPDGDPVPERDLDYLRSFAAEIRPFAIVRLPAPGSRQGHRLPSLWGRPEGAEAISVIVSIADSDDWLASNPPVRPSGPPDLGKGWAVRDARSWEAPENFPADHSTGDPFIAEYRDAFSPASASPAKSGPAEEEPNANVYRVWFGTNRQTVAPGPDTSFCALRDKITRHGFCDVVIPKSHKIGSTGSSFLARLFTRLDDRLRLRRLKRLEEKPFWKALSKQLARTTKRRRHAVVFVHGYNVSFNDAAIRAAQLGFDLGIEGAMAFFSWPSKGTVEGYPADEASIEASEPAIAKFLVDFAEKTDAEAVHIIAHSMGNRGILRAVSRIASSARERTGRPFANIILAAPDVDVDTFSHLADAYAKVAARTTLYVSARDRAVALSRWLHAYPRVGFSPPISVFDGIDTVSVTNVDLTMLGHGYVAEAREVLSDMHSVLLYGRAPEERFSLERLETQEGQQYWAVRS